MANPFSRSGGSYMNDEIERFLEATHVPENDALRFAEAVLAERDMPQIQVSPTDGRILQLLLRMIGARKVVEFGTLSGYSGLWLLDGMRPDGHLWTVEADPAHADAAADVFARAGVSDRVDLIVSTGLEALATLSRSQPFDAVFIDADKISYPRYAEWAFENLRSGGLIIGDNAYLFGYLAGRAPEGEETPERIQAMQAFHRFLADNTLSVCLPTTEGLAVGLKP